MNSSKIFKILFYLGLFLILFFFLVNNINFVSNLQARNGTLSKDLTAQQENLSNISRDQNRDLGDEIREKESKGELEFVTQSDLIGIEELIPESGGQDEEVRGVR
jgi:hypothetical protein